MKKEEVQKTIKNGYFWYTDTVKNYVDEKFDGDVYTMMRPRQLRNASDILSKEFKFDTIKCIETGASHDIKGDGAVGLYLAHICKETGGEFHSVDIDGNLVKKSKKMYKELGFDNVNYHTQDSVEYLENTEFIPNLIHLDSWDVNLKNPMPSALHGWREFTAIKDKMPVGSIIIIDDNWFDGTWQEWITRDEDGELQNEVINVSYTVLGKGAMVWHYIKDKMITNADWEIIGDWYDGGEPRKIYIKKVK